LRTLREAERQRLRGGSTSLPEIGDTLRRLRVRPDLAGQFALLVGRHLEADGIAFPARAWLVTEGVALGVRPFECHVIIAAMERQICPRKLTHAAPPPSSKPRPDSWLHRWWRPIVVVLILEVIALALYLGGAFG
jgi:hypothetical protein